MKIKYICIFIILINIINTKLLTNTSLSYAVDTRTNFEQSNVLTDLRNSVLSDGTPFDIENYPYEEGGEIKIVNFVEYAYAKNKINDIYSLYIYIYNPAKVKIDPNARNKVQMAIEYDSEGFPITYEKFDLKFCNRSELNDTEYLFYKFKVIDHMSSDGKTIQYRVNSERRNYSISGVEFYSYGTFIPIEYSIAYSYIFTGYSIGLGDDNEESTLRCEVKELEVIQITDIGSTSYRIGLSNKGFGYDYNLSTVYFSISNYYLETYGNLQRIKAEFNEYKTKDIIVTTSTALHSFLNDRLYKETYNNMSSGARSLYQNPVDLPNLAGVGDTLPFGVWDWAWNPTHSITEPNLIILSPYEKILYYNFLVNDINTKISANELKEYINNYDGNKADLFQSVVDDGRIYGYNQIVVDAGDLINLLMYEGTWWDKIIDNGLFSWLRGEWPDNLENIFDIAPIYKVQGTDLIGSNETIANRLYIGIEEVEDIKSRYLQASLDDMSLFLFRFAVTDYYSAYLTVVTPNIVGMFENIENNVAYRCNQTVFLGFDIIELVFNKDSEYYVIPIVANPIDVVSGVGPPNVGGSDILKIIFVLISIILGIVVVIAILPLVFNLLVFLVKLLIKGISKLIKFIKEKISFFILFIKDKLGFLLMKIKKK